MIVSIIQAILIFSGYFIKFKNRKNFYIFTVIVFAILGFFILPTEGMDLYRHYEMLDFMRNHSFQDSVEQYDYILKDLPIYAWYFYIVSFLGFNQFLLVFTYVIVYGVQLGILHMAVKDFSLSYQAEKIGYLFIICTINIYELTGIRNMTAFSICILFLYLELVRNKHRIFSWCIYIALCFFHDSVFLFVIIRLLLLVVNKKKLKWLAVFVMLWPILIDRIIIFLSGYLQSAFGMNILQKLVLYSSEDADIFTSGFSFKLMLWLRFILVISVAIRIMFIKKKEYIKWNSFFLLVVMFCIGGMTEEAIVVRFLPLALYMMVPYIGIIYTRKRYSADISTTNTVFKLILLGTIALHFISLVIFQYPYFKIGLF